MSEQATMASPESAYFKTKIQALEEIKRRRTAYGGEMITRCEETPYGEYRVYSVPADIFVDDLTDPLMPNTGRSIFQLY